MDIIKMNMQNKEERLKRKKQVGEKKTPFTKVVLNKKHNDDDDDIESPEDYDSPYKQNKPAEAKTPMISHSRKLEYNQNNLQLHPTPTGSSTQADET